MVMRRLPKGIPTHLTEKIKKFIKISIENDGKIVTSKEAMILFGYSEKSYPYNTLANLFLRHYYSYEHPKSIWEVVAKTAVDMPAVDSLIKPTWHRQIKCRNIYKHKITWYKLVEHGGWL